MNTTSFPNIRFDQIRAFIHLLDAVQDRRLDYLARRFGQHALDFESTIQFFASLNLIDFSADGLISESKAIKSLFGAGRLSDDSLQSWTLKILIETNHYYSDEMARYLGKYSRRGDQYRYYPVIADRISENNLRNLLIELGLVEHNYKEDFYYISQDSEDIFRHSTDFSAISPDRLLAILQSQRDLGLEAEKVVIDIERERLKKFPDLVLKVEHTALTNVAAGYDIESYEIGLNYKPVKKYIEVKAVSQLDYRFYWSSTEIQASKVLGKNYYLYLLPVVNNKAFDVEGLQIVNDPFIEIFEGEEWGKSVETYKIRKLTLQGTKRVA